MVTDDRVKELKELKEQKETKELKEKEFSTACEPTFEEQLAALPF